MVRDGGRNCSCYGLRCGQGCERGVYECWCIVEWVPAGRGGDRRPEVVFGEEVGEWVMGE